MKILLYSHAFYPSLGGVETVSKELAEGFLRFGHECKVITKTKSTEIDHFSYSVVRNPSFLERQNLIKWSEIIIYNGISLSMIGLAIFYRRPIIWIHVGYQVSCIDGLGWYNGESAPLTLFKSFIFHLNKKNWNKSILGLPKVIMKKIVSHFIVNQNVAITNWMAEIQPLPKQRVIYNPFPLDAIKEFTVNNRNENSLQFDFVFLGRLVSEKGVLTLFKAFRVLLDEYNPNLRLLVIGDGNLKNMLLDKAEQLKISEKVHFAGKLMYERMWEMLTQARIGIVPSEWYEPMGGVALEMLSAGLPVIVSEYGGLKECIGKSGLTFKNGDQMDLANKMKLLVTNESLFLSLKSNIENDLKSFDPDTIIESYISMVKEYVKDEM